MPHDIHLDDLLADAAQHLKDSEMLGLSHAVQIARERLSGMHERDTPAPLASGTQLPLGLVR
jgi:hypothetical protein